MQPTPAAPPRARGTPARQRIFIVALYDTGCVTRAAAAAGMSRSSAHRLRARLTGTPFDRAWESALVRWAGAMAHPFDPALDPPAAQPARSGAR